MKDRLFLQHALDAIERIFKYTQDGRDAFWSDTKTQDAVLRNIEVIGEAVKNLSQEFRDAHSELPWRDIAGMRDRLIHGYAFVKLDLVWAVVERDAPDLKAKIELLLLLPEPPINPA